MKIAKDCPFCGCDDCRVQVETYGKWARVFCPLCGASTMSVQVGYNDPALAVKLWNERADDRIAELEANIEILKDQQREARNILIDKKLQIDSLYEAGYKLQQRIAELEAENAALKAEPKPLAYWSDEKKQTYADNEGRSAKRSEE